VWEDCGAVPGFTRRYGVGPLVWFEVFDDVTAAIRREKTLKHRLRAWKIALIERANPTWRDLYDENAFHPAAGGDGPGAAEGAQMSEQSKAPGSGRTWPASRR